MLFRSNWAAGKSFVGSTLCQWQVISLRIRNKHIEKGLHEEISDTGKLELKKKKHPSQDMTNLKYRADTDIDVQRDMNYSSMPYMARSVYSENIFIVNLLGKAWSCVQGPHPNQWEKKAIRSSADP